MGARVQQALLDADLGDLMRKIEDAGYTVNVVLEAKLKHKEDGDSSHVITLVELTDDGSKFFARYEDQLGGK